MEMLTSDTSDSTSCLPLEVISIIGVIRLCAYVCQWLRALSVSSILRLSLVVILLFSWGGSGGPLTMIMLLLPSVSVSVVSAVSVTEPSVRPSVAPSSYPTYPTSAPTSVPSVPTSLPSSTPTMAPSYSQTYWENLWLSDLAALQTNLSLTDTDATPDAYPNRYSDPDIAVYTEVVVNGVYVRGGCAEWQAFIGGALLARTAAGRKPMSLLLAGQGEHGQGASRAAWRQQQCSASSLSGNITDVLTGFASADTGFRCADLTSNSSVDWWVLSRARSCQHGLGLYVGSDPLYFSTPYCAAQCWPLLSIAPCQKLCEQSNHIRVFVVHYEPLPPAPNVTIHYTNFTGAGTVGLVSVRLVLSLDAAGVVYCAAVSIPAVIDTGYYQHESLASLTVEAIIAGAGSHAVVSPLDVGLPVNLVIGGLLPSTRYALLCVTESVGGVPRTTAASFTESLAMMASVISVTEGSGRTSSTNGNSTITGVGSPFYIIDTPCCKTLHVTLLTTSVPVVDSDDSSSGPNASVGSNNSGLWFSPVALIRLRMDALPTIPVVINVTLHNTDTATGLVVPTNYFYPSTLITVDNTTAVDAGSGSGSDSGFDGRVTSNDGRVVFWMRACTTSDALCAPAPAPGRYNVSVTVMPLYPSASAAGGQQATEFLVQFDRGHIVTLLNASQLLLQASNSHSNTSATSTLLTVEPDPPAAVSAEFSVDGTSVTLSFDSPTDRQQGYPLSVPFPCHRLLLFENISTTLTLTCVWTSSTMVQITPTSSSSRLLVPGSNVTVLGGVIKSECWLYNVVSHSANTGSSSSSNNCVSWPYAPAVSVLVTAPQFPLAPQQVVLSVANLVGGCDDLMLDLSAAGSGGRAWRNVSFAVAVDDPAAEKTTAAPTLLENNATSSLLDWLNAQELTTSLRHSLSPPPAIPRVLLTAGLRYTISATLCTFLGACAQSNVISVVAVAAPLPTVSIHGLTTRQMKRASRLVLSSSDAYLKNAAAGLTCDSGSSSIAVKSYKNLVYLWKVFSFVNQDEISNSNSTGELIPVRRLFDIVPINQQQQSSSRLVLSKFTLSAGKRYLFQLTVVSGDSETAVSAAAVVITVVSGSIVAVIAGGTDRQLAIPPSPALAYRLPTTVTTTTAAASSSSSLLLLLVLDASGSFDEDMDAGAAAGAVAPLSYSWSCEPAGTPAGSSTGSSTSGSMGADTVSAPANFSSACGVQVVPGTAVNTSVLLLRASNSFSYSTVSLVTVRVSAGPSSNTDTGTGSVVAQRQRQRWGEAVVRVTTVSSAAPLVTVTTSASTPPSTLASKTKYNVNSRLNLAGTVTAREAGYAVWSVSSVTLGMDAATAGSLSRTTSSLPSPLPPPFSLSAGALTPLNRSFAAPMRPLRHNEVTTTKLSVFLALPPLTMPPGASLLFTLTCTLTSGLTSSSSLLVITNAAPRPGLFSITPEIGSALNTSFLFIASAWSDTDGDLPLRYLFAYMDPVSGKSMTLQSMSELAYGTSVLPPGKEQDDWIVSCSVSVMDSMGATDTHSTDTVAVQVTTIPSIMNVTELSILIAAQLTATAGRLDATRQVLVTATSVINTANCSSAPAVSTCAALHRGPCGSVDHTCGPCLDGFDGDSGDTNTRCVALSNNITIGTTGIAAMLSSVPVGSPCLLDNDCDLWSMCTNISNNTGAVNTNNVAVSAAVGVCKRQPQICPGTVAGLGMNCSGHGVCMYVDRLSGMEHSGDCLQGDLACSAVCNCAVGYAGPGCGLTDSELVARQQVRGQLLDGLYSLVHDEGEGPSGAAAGATGVYQSWAVTLGALTQRVSEIPLSAAATVGNVAGAVLDAASTTGTVARVGEISAVVAALDSMVQVLLTNASSSVNGNYTGLNRTIIFSLAGWLQQFAALQAAELVPGEPAVDSLHSWLRLSTLAVGGDTGSTSTHTPLTVAEAIGDVLPSATVVLTTGTGADTIETGVDVATTGSTSLVLMDASLFGWSSSPPSLTSDGHRSRLDSDPLLLTTPSDLHRDCTNTTTASTDRNCWSLVTLRNREPVTAVDLTDYSLPFQNFTAVCVAGVTSVESFVCDANNESVVASCNGDQSGILTVFCPHVYLGSVCMSLPILPGDSDTGSSSSSSSNPVKNNCEMVSFTADYVSCICPPVIVAAVASTATPIVTPTLFSTTASALASASATSLSLSVSHQLQSRRQQRLLSSSSSDQMVALVSARTTVTRVFADTFVVVVPPNIHSIYYVLAPLLLLGVFAALGGFGGWWCDCEYIDRRHPQRHRTWGCGWLTSFADRTEAEWRARVTQSRVAAQLMRMKGDGAMLTAAERAVEEVLPAVLRSHLSLKKHAELLRRAHRWLGLFYFHAHYSRPLRILKLTTDLLAVMLALALVLPWAYPDNSQCKHHTVADACLADKWFWGGDTQCQFVAAVGNATIITAGGTITAELAAAREGHCSYRSPGESLRAVALLALCAVILTAPVRMLSDWLVHGVLSAPVIGSKVAAAADEESNEGAEVSESVAAVADSLVQQQKFVVGMKVQARYRGGEVFYPGTIARVVGNGSYDIEYQFLPNERGVRAPLIRPADTGKGARTGAETLIPTWEVGSQVKCRYYYHLRWLPATVTRVRMNGTYDVQFRDGRKQVGVAAASVVSRDSKVGSKLRFRYNNNAHTNSNSSSRSVFSATSSNSNSNSNSNSYSNGMQQQEDDDTDTGAAGGAAASSSLIKVGVVVHDYGDGYFDIEYPHGGDGSGSCSGEREIHVKVGSSSSGGGSGSSSGIKNNKNNSTMVQLQSPVEVGFVRDRAAITGRRSVVGGRGALRSRFRMTVDDDLSELVSEIRYHRETLIMRAIANAIPAEPLRRSFDAAWGIDSESGAFFPPTVLERSFCYYCCCGCGRGSAAAVGGGVLTEIVADLRECRHRAAGEIEELSLPHVSDRQRGQRLLQLFQQDLLPAVGASAVQAIVEQGRPPILVWHADFVHWFAWVLVLGGDVVMTIYVIEFAVQRSSPMQVAWLLSFVAYLLLELFVLATVTAYVYQVWLPLLALPALMQTRDQVLQCVKQFWAAGGSSDNQSGSGTAAGAPNRSPVNGVKFVPRYPPSGGSSQGPQRKQQHQQEDEPFNAAEFFHVSARVAARFPDLPASKAVLSYSTQDPKHSYQSVMIHTTTQQQQQQWSVCGGSDGQCFDLLGRLVAGAFSAFLRLPLLVQYAVLDVLLALLAVIGAAALWWVYNIFIPLFVLVIVVCVLGMHFISLSHTSKMVDARRPERLKQLVRRRDPTFASRHQHRSTSLEFRERRAALAVVPVPLASLITAAASTTSPGGDSDSADVDAGYAQWLEHLSLSSDNSNSSISSNISSEVSSSYSSSSSSDDASNDSADDVAPNFDLSSESDLSSLQSADDDIHRAPPHYRQGYRNYRRFPNFPMIR